MEAKHYNKKDLMKRKYNSLVVDDNYKNDMVEATHAKLLKPSHKNVDTEMGQ